MNHRIFHSREQKNFINRQNEQIFMRLQEIHKVRKALIFDFTSTVTNLNLFLEETSVHK